MSNQYSTLKIITALFLLFLISLTSCSSPGADEQPEDDSVRSPDIAAAEFLDASRTAESGQTPEQKVSPSLTAKSEANTSTPTATVVSEPPATMTQLPTAEITPSQTPTDFPTMTPAVTETPEPTPTTSPDRYCPDPSPLKPEYDRFYLSPSIWPAPDPDKMQPHLWLTSPLPGADQVSITQRYPYGWDDNGRLLLHNGIDMIEEQGTPVLAVADGTVVVAQSDMNAWYGWRCNWYGQLVVIELDDQWLDQAVYALYGHILNLQVAVGDRVARGDQVAEVGFGGVALNPHLHFELRVGENEFAATRNPMLWFDPGSSRGVVAGRLVDPEGRPWQGVPILLFSQGENPDKLTTWSYLGDPDQLMNPDEGWAENFVFSDLPPGEYDLLASIQGNEYRLAVQVSAGQLTFVEVQTAAFRDATPTAESP